MLIPLSSQMKPEALVNQQACDGPGRRDPCPPMNEYPGHPGEPGQISAGKMGREDAARHDCREAPTTFQIHLAEESATLASGAR